MIKVGDKVYAAIGNGLREETVCKVGRKYFYLEGDYQKTPFDIKTLLYTDKMRSQNNIKLWRSVEEYEDWVNQGRMLAKLKETLYPSAYGNYNPDLRITVYLQVCELLNIKGNYKAEVIRNE